MFLTCTNAALRNFKKIPCSWSSLSKDEPEFDFSTSLPVPFMCLQSVAAGLSETLVVFVSSVSVAYCARGMCLSMMSACCVLPVPNKGLCSVFSKQHRKHDMGKDDSGLSTEIINRALQGKKSSTHNCAQILATYLYSLCPSLIEHFPCLSNPAFILLANGHHSAYIRYSAPKAWKNTQQDEIYAVTLCYKSLLHGQSKALKS